MKDGIYFLYPEGSAWVGAIVKDGKLWNIVTASDSLAGIFPRDTDIVVDDCEEIILQVMGAVDPGMVVVTRPVPVYILHMDDGCSDEIVVSKESPDIEDAIEDWVADGEWGNDGAEISVSWRLEYDNEDVDEGSHTVSIEPNHSYLIARATGDRSCGNEPDDHDWTAEGEGGCKENPGVWLVGGTGMTFDTHCRKCGLHRHEYHTGSQKNPGEHDTVTYEMPDSWCATCEREKCCCEGS